MHGAKIKIGVTLPLPLLLYVYNYFKEIYCTESKYSVYKDKVHNCSYNQLDKCLRMVQVELKDMSINIGANNGSEK
jgi:hypothetical protein